MKAFTILLASIASIAAAASIPAEPMKAQPLDATLLSDSELSDLDKRSSLSVTIHSQPGGCGGNSVTYTNVQNGCWKLSGLPDGSFWSFTPSGNSNCVVFAWTDPNDCGGTPFGAYATGQCAIGEIDNDGLRNLYQLYTMSVNC